jgi:hypothetical protein
MCLIETVSSRFGSTEIAGDFLLTKLGTSPESIINDA